jgi:hypothetical protein
MKRSLLLGFSIAGLALATALSAFAVNTAQAQEASSAAAQPVKDTGKFQPEPPQADTDQAPVSCNFCYSCGGNWPVFAGSFRSVGDLPKERDSACAGALEYRSDSSPYLCCR